MFKKKNRNFIDRTGNRARSLRISGFSSDAGDPLNKQGTTLNPSPHPFVTDTKGTRFAPIGLSNLKGGGLERNCEIKSCDLPSRDQIKQNGGMKSTFVSERC